jgi:hypothetical protein
MYLANSRLVASQALAAVVKELRREAAALCADDGMDVAEADST